MNTSNVNNYISILEETVFEHSEEDLFNILVKNKDLFDEFNKISSEELYSKKKEYMNNSNKLLKILLKKIEITDLINELDKFEKYQIKPIVKKNFPYEKPRKYQLETISKIYDAIEKGYKFIILEAVSGFGKSGVATTLSEIYSNEKTYILNTTRQLSSQYYNEFEGHSFNIIYPRSDYKCKKNEKTTCTVSKCKGQRCPFNKKENCNFLSDLNKSLKSNICLTSYSLFILEHYFQSEFLNGRQKLPKRKLLILDEGHNVDDLVCSNVNLELYKGRLDDAGINLKTEAEYLEESEEYYIFLEKSKLMYEKLLTKYKKGSNKYNQYYQDLLKINKFLEYFKNDYQNIAFKNINNSSLRFTPIKVNNIINKVLLDYGDVCLFMSSSIFDSENFNKDLGIDEKDVYVLKVPNIFELSNNPITIYNNFNMSLENLKNGTAEDTIPIIEEILNNHKYEKGVIHTVSDECKNFLVNNLKSDRIIFHKSSDDREDKLNKFKESKQPLVFISPSMNEGVDIPGDECRFQIIYKLPFISKTERVTRRWNTYDDGEEWYLYKMLTRLIQTYGRGIRFEGDYCKTYIIDNRIWEIIENDLDNHKIIPQYFLDAIEELNE